MPTVSVRSLKGRSFLHETVIQGCIQCSWRCTGKASNLQICVFKFETLFYMLVVVNGLSWLKREIMEPMPQFLIFVVVDLS